MKEKKFDYFWTLTGAILGVIVAFILEFPSLLPYISETLESAPFLKNLSSFFHTISCVLWSYFLYSLKQSYWKGKAGSPKIKKTIDKIAIILMVVIPLSLCIFWKQDIITWLLLTLLSIAISYLISVSDIVNPAKTGKRKNKRKKKK